MQVWCGQSASQLGDQTPDLVVFPEGIGSDQIASVAAYHPQTIVVGAVLDANRMRGVVWHRSRNWIRYAKVGSDGQTDGGPPPGELPIYIHGEVAIGVLICMDVQLPTLRNSVVDALRRSAASFKILCVPADMQGGAWFVGDEVGPAWTGVSLALSNGVFRSPTNRLASFITDVRGAKIAIQVGTEPVSYRLDGSL